jgi:hypothetical protein
MGLREDAVIPRIRVARDGIRFIVEFQIANNSRACRIGSTNTWLTMEKSIRLIEIDGLGDVGGDNRVVLANLGNTIHLNGQEDGDAVFFQLLRQRHGFRGAPAHPIDNDAGIALFFSR